MRIIIILAIAGLLNTLTAETTNAQSPVINSLIKKSYNGSDVSCYGVKDAQVTVNASGGTGTLTYSINGGAYQQSNVFSNLGQGHYFFTVKDANNKVSGRWDLDISTPNELRITSLFNTGGTYGGSTSCFGSSDGSFGLTVDGGTGSVLASKDNGATYQSAYYFDKLAATTYQVKIKDVNGCYATGSYTVKGPDSITATFNQTDFSCSTSKGSVTITPSGGAGSYHYNVDNAATTWSTTFQNLSEGTHNVKITDYRGCNSIVPVTLSSNYTAAISGNSTTCTGTSGSFKIAISSGISNDFTAVYQDNSGAKFTVSNLKAGNNSVVTNGILVNQTFSLVSVKSQTACMASVNGTATVTPIDPGTWLGTNHNWNDGRNWSCGAIPNFSTNVTIPVTGNDPVVPAGNSESNNITINQGASLTVLGTLKISGNIGNNGTFDAKLGTLQFDGGPNSLTGARAQTISGSWFVDKTINNLVVSNTKGLNLYSTANDTLNITGILSFGQSNCAFNTNNNLTLKSTVKATAGVADITNNGTLKGNSINGDVTVERYVNIGNEPGQHSKTWLMVSTPTKGKSIYQTWMENGDKSVIGYGTQIPGKGTGFDGTSVAPSLKYFSDAVNNWVGITNTNDPVYNPLGYMLFVRGDRTTAYPDVSHTTLRTTGNLITGSTEPIAVKAGKFQSIGNPYASAVDIRKISATGINPDIIVWDPTLTVGNPYGVGAYQTLYKDGDNYRNLLASPTFGPAGTINNNIESGVAFFVQSYNTDGQVYFTESAKVATVGKGIAMREQTAAEDVAGLSVRLFVVASNGSSYVADGVLQQFSSQFSNEINGMDTRKIYNSAENLAIISNNQKLVIERRQALSATDTINYQISNVTNQKYRLIFTASGIENTAVNGFVIDSYTKTETPLNSDGDTPLDFIVSSDAASKAANRFKVVFRTLKTMPVTFTSVKANVQNNKVSVNWNVENQSNMKRYEVERSADGKNFTQIAEVAASNIASASYNWLDENPAQGNNYYRIHSLDINGKAEYSSIVKAQISNVSVSIKIYPNPAVDAKVNIQLVNQPGGVYYARLLNAIGQEIASKKIVCATGNSTETIEWNKNAARGIYNLQITMPDGSINVTRLQY